MNDTKVSSSMNGTKVLVIAAALGVAGAALNWYYLHTKSQQLEKIEFLCIAPGETVRSGERFTDDKLAPLAIPKNNVTDSKGKVLREDAILYSDRAAVIGMTAVRNFEQNEIILRQDLKAPPPTLALTKPNERAIFIPVDTRTFVAPLVVPGDTVTFVVGGGAFQPTPAAPAENGEAAPDENLPAAGPPPSAELIGPFRVLSLGNRLGSAEVLKASGVPQMQENVMAVAVEVDAKGELQQNAAKLWKMLQATGFRQVGVLLHPRVEK
jgi:Flp pilus assembly protein CpaB